MKKLLIVESPAKIKTIQKFLDKDFRIVSTVGHIIDLPSRTVGVTVTPDAINLEYVVMEDKEKVIANICKEAATSQEIYLAPDPDREGEIIAWHIGEEIKRTAPKTAKIHRISFNEITESAILDAIAHPYSIDMHKVAAQQARRVLDRWVGYEVSPILWQKIKKGLSAGRVQSVALRLICDREEIIRNFTPEEYWSITGLFKQQSAGLEAALTHINKKKAEIKNKEQSDKIIAELKKTAFILDKIEDKTRLKNPLPPFMTSTLQQAAFNRLGFGVKKTMQIAQQLYEGIPLDDPKSPVALITYMRTDSLRLSDTALKQARTFIERNYTKEYLPSKATVYEKSKSKGKKDVAAQDAHEAVRPIDISLTPQQVSRYLPKDAARLYELIWQRCVASQMKPAEYAQRQVTLLGDKYTFKATGSTLIFDGFLKVYGVEEDDEESKSVIPNTLKEKADTVLHTIDPKQHFTQPPARFSEASLVKELEKEGIGRPSTYASILSTIQARSYTTLDTKKRFTPTELGMTVTKMLVDNLPKIMDPKFTALMEQDLDKIANDDMDRDKLLREFYKDFQEDLATFRGKEGKGRRAPEPTNVECPECKQAKLAIRFGKSGEFLGCMNFPECSFTCNFKRNEDGTYECTEAEKPKILDKVCPQCSKPLREIVGKFGPFISCSGYPECKYIHKEVADISCPDCKGDLVQRAWRGGKFWGCSNYPKCKFAIFGEIEKSPCPSCKRPFLAKKVYKDGSIVLTCTDKKCGYTNK